MEDPEKQESLGVSGTCGGKKLEEEERLLKVVDFDLLCSTVALQTQGKWRKLNQLDDYSGDGEAAESGGVFRMWEGEVLDCFDDRRIALQSACCPCYRFGKNMGRAGFGSCLIQGTVYYTLVLCTSINFLAFIVTRQHYFLYLAVAFTIMIGTYTGFFRTQMRKKFNIRGGDSLLDDCVYHLICPCCTICQESRTLEMNNVQDGSWHGRGDTLCIGSYAEGGKTFLELPAETKSPDPGAMQKIMQENI